MTTKRIATAFANLSGVGFLVALGIFIYLLYLPVGAQFITIQNHQGTTYFILRAQVQVILVSACLSILATLLNFVIWLKSKVQKQ